MTEAGVERQVERAEATDGWAPAGRRPSPPHVRPADFVVEQLDGPGPRPEHRLMIAVLDDALTAFERFATAVDRRGRREFHDAQAWFARDDREWPFSFRNVCDELGLDGVGLRAALWRWRAAQIDVPVDDSPRAWLERFRARQRASAASLWPVAS